MFVDGYFLAKQREAIEMDITGIAKSHQENRITAGKPSFKKEWKLSDSLWEKMRQGRR